MINTPEEILAAAKDSLELQQSITVEHRAVFAEREDQLRERLDQEEPRGRLRRQRQRDVRPRRTLRWVA